VAIAVAGWKQSKHWPLVGQINNAGGEHQAPNRDKHHGDRCL